MGHLTPTQPIPRRDGLVDGTPASASRDQHAEQAEGLKHGVLWRVSQVVEAEERMNLSKLKTVNRPDFDGGSAALIHAAG